MVTEEELKNMSPEEIAELQKQNCIFCKIIKGEIPAIKVYESDLVIAILDINPAKKGHVLVLPKEHHPILPLIPPETFTELFSTAQLLSESIKQAMMVPAISLFIANGAVAGQQSPHFLFHIIPREPGDNLTSLNIPSHPEKSNQQDELFPSMKHNLGIMLENHFKRQGKRPPQNPLANSAHSSLSADSSSPSAEIVSSDRQEQIAHVLEQNPQARELIKTNPEEFKKQIEQNEETKKFFEGIDIDALSLALNKIPLEQKEKPSKDEESTQEDFAQNTSSNQPKPEVFLGREPYKQKEKIFAYFEEKPQAKQLLMDDPEHFKTLLEKREDIQELFKDINIDKLSEKLNEAYGKQKREEQNE
jgi:histidine triad (HIT) family protein